MNKRIAAVIVLLAVLLLSASCSVKNDYPPDGDSPEPEPHDGVFVCEHGTMTFNGDGESIVFDFSQEFAEATGLPAGEQSGSYVFLFQHGKWRCDKAERFRITASDASYDFINVFTLTDENTIALQSPIDGKENVLFVKEDVNNGGKQNG